MTPQPLILRLKINQPYLLDTSQPSELHNTGFVPLSPKSNVWNSISRNQTPITHSPSAGSNHSHASTVSRSSGPRSSPISPARADSVTLNEQAGGATRERIHSDLSSVTESERTHLRQISDASVSVDGDYGNLPMPEIQIERPHEEREIEQEVERPAVVSPLTPPQGVGQGRQHYFGPDSVGGNAAQNVPAPETRRKSNFEEKLDE